MRAELPLAFRRLVREPALAIATILTLAIGIGACTAMFSVLHAVLLQPMDVARPDQLVLMWPQVGATPGEFPYNTYRELKRDTTAFAGVALIGSTNWPIPVNIVFPDGRRGRATQRAVSGTFFDVLGARPLLGRTFRDDDDRPGADPVIVVSAPFWRNRLAGDARIIDRPLQIGDTAWRVVGVMPPEFFYPSGADVWTPAGRLLPTITADKSPAAIAGMFEDVSAFHLLARVKPGISIAHAQALGTRAWKTASRQPVPATSALGMRPFLDHVFGAARRALWLLMGAVVLVLLIASANVVGLFIARAAARQREVAVRAALGASRWQLAHQDVLDTCVLAGIGGALGVFVAAAGLRALIVLAPAAILRLPEAHIDGVALVVALLTTTSTAVLVGLLPALTASRTSALQQLLSTRDAGRSVRSGIRRALVGGQVAITSILLVCTGLTVQSFVRLMRVDLGFDPSRVVALKIGQMDQEHFPTYAALHRATDELTRNLSQLPGVEATAAVTNLPFANGVIGWDTGLLFEGQPETEASWLSNPSANWEAVTPQYFQTMGMRVLRGRDFAVTDRAGAPLVVIVSENLASRIWPGQDPIGKRLRDSLVGRSTDKRPARWQTVVGVVNSARYREMDRAWLDVYVPFAQTDDFMVDDIVVRAHGDPRALVAPAAALLHQMDPQLTSAAVNTLDNMMAGVRAPWRFNMTLFAIFGAVSVILTMVGIAGLLVAAVNWRRREIAVRLAIGARPAQVIALIVLQAARPIGGGVLAGIATALTGARLMAGLLFDTPPTSVLVFGLTTCGLLLVTAVACYLPARRAAAVDPCVVFRGE